MSLTDSQKVIRNDTGKSIVKAILDVESAIISGGFSGSVIASLLNKENYKRVMRSWFNSRGASAMTDYTKLCEEWYAMVRTGWTGGVRFVIPAEGQAASSDGTKTGDNYGLSCTPSTTATATTDD